MGANYDGQEKAIIELAALSHEAKQYLNHHIGNALAVIVGAARLGQYDVIHQHVDHIVDDLTLAGIRDKSFRR